MKTPTDEEVKNRIREFVQEEKSAPGIVVGIIDEKGARVLAQGIRKAGETNQVNAETLFEIGSITKVFTCLLLQEMIDAGELKLEDPIGKFLPPSQKTPTRNGKQITLVDLATHTSGLPRLPANLSKWHILMHMDNPYADYTVAKLYEFLGDYKLKRDIGAEYEYSNVGVGLLGYLLSLKAGTNYESLVINRICAPLGMNSTRIHLSPDLQTRFATGHSEAGKPVRNWDDTPALEACGALRSSVNDMLKFLAANMGVAGSPLTEAMLKTHQARHDADLGGKVALGWHINTDGVIWHNGGTGGYRSYMGFHKQRGRGIVVLSNSETDVDDLGLFILGPVKEHRLATIDSKIYDRYLGEYKFGPGAKLTVTRDGDRLFARLTGQGKIEFFAESETNFFCKVVEAELWFVKGDRGVEAVILHQNGMDQRAPKVK